MNTPNEQTIHAVLRHARRAEGVTQSGLAAELDCRQSAISMFESGHTNALAWETVERFAARFDVDLSPWAGLASAPATASRIQLRYCPIADCPSNVPYQAGNTTCFKPRLVTTHAEGPTHCRLCGEVLEACCPNPDCRAAVHEGAFCPFCGEAYVAALPARHNTPAWVTRQRQSISKLFDLTQTEKSISRPTPLNRPTPTSRRQPATSGSTS